MTVGARLRAERKRLGSALGRLSLRARLVLGLVLVAALGLVVADFAVYNQVESYLVGQVDNQLSQPSNQLIDWALTPRFRSGFAGFSQTVQCGTFWVVVAADGQTWGGSASSCDNGVTPQLPSDVVVLAADGHGPGALENANSVAALPSTYLTVGSAAKSSTQYRVYAKAIPIPVVGGGAETGAAIVAFPLTTLDATMHDLVFIELVASLAVLGALLLLGLVVVRAAMRPLREIELTAGAIAGGDLSRRVVRDDERTEVGRLGASLNVMLAQIEHAFAERRASEDQLRQFLADASHELRTPVTSIRGYSELFRRGAQDNPEDLALAMRRIEDESVRMGVLVDDLLLLARLDQGRPLERAEVDLTAIVTDTAADAQVRVPEAALSVEATGPIVVLGDEARLRQVATNLVSNAIVHTPVGTPISVRLDSDGANARVIVADEGPGVAPEHAAHVFERFYRADPSRVRESGGAGLGLSIVASIAHAHGGSARLEATPGGGATFVVELPLRGAEDAGACVEDLSHSSDAHPLQGAIGGANGDGTEPTAARGEDEQSARERG